MSFEHAREYLARVIPWPQSGDEPGYCSVHWKFIPKDWDHNATRPLPWTGRAVRSVDEAVRTISWAQGLPETRDIYVALGRTMTAQERVSSTGRKYLAPIRVAENISALKSLFLDIDGYKDGPTGYPTLDEAVAELARFLRETGMPKPSLIVRSGGGLHVYWTMSRALSPDEWKPLAFALVEATKRHGLRCDTGVTTDCARILRVPDTFNLKTDPPRPVKLAGRPADFDYTVERIAQALKPYEVPVPMAAASAMDNPALFPPRRAVSDDPLSAGVELHMSRDEIRLCLDAIPNNKTDWNWWNTIGMRIYAACGGADYGLEEWERWSATNTTAGDADSCSSRWETFHNSPPSRTGAGALINEARAAKGDPAWLPRVAPVAPQGVTPGVATTPIVAPSSPAASDLPPGYVRSPDGLIMQLILQEDGTHKPVPICDYRMDDPWLQVDPRILHFTTKAESGRPQQIVLPLDVVGTVNMRAHLQAQGLMLPVGPKGIESVSRFFVSWIKKLQETKDAVTSSPFGWNVRGSKLEGFVFGGRLWTPTGDSAAATPDNVTARHYTPTGDITPWINAAKLITDQNRQDLAAIVASAFGAPLVRFTGLPGVLMSAYSTESGIGKSTALKVAQAVWGDPIRGVQSLADTQNAVMNKIGELRSLPLYWDELKTEEDTRKFVQITFQISQGKEKARMTRSIQQREPGSWQTLLVSASNDSLLDYVVNNTNTTTAGLYRVFEFAVKPGTEGQIDPSEASLIVAQLHDNYGVVGLEYAKYLGGNHATIEQEVAAYLKELGNEVATKPDERFWVALVTVICLGARYANRLGVTQFDEPAIRAFMLDVLGQMRAERSGLPSDMSKEVNISTIMQRFLGATRQRHTLITNRLHTGKGKPPAGMIKTLSDTSKVDGLYVHIGMEDKLMRISSTYFSEWLNETGYSRHIVMTKLRELFGARNIQARIGSGTHLAGTTEHLIELNIAGSDVLNFIDET